MATATASVPTSSDYRPDSHPDNHPHNHAKTGEPRHVQRVLRLDCLPLALLDRVRATRLQGRSWEDIEHDAPHWPEWEQASPEALAEFPDRRLPHSSLRRWYDLRVEQVRRQQEAITLAAQALGDRLAEHGFQNLNAAVKNALGTIVFRLMVDGADEKLMRDEFFRLAKTLIAMDRLELARQRMELERHKQGFSKTASGDRTSAVGRSEATSTLASVLGQKDIWGHSPSVSQADEVELEDECAAAETASTDEGEIPAPPASARVDAAGEQPPANSQKESAKTVGSGPGVTCFPYADVVAEGSRGNAWKEKSLPGCISAEK